MFNFKKNLIIVFSDQKIKIKNSFFYDICFIDLESSNINYNYKYYFKRKKEEDKYESLAEIFKYIKYKNYEYIWVTDQDIEVSQKDIIKLFKLNSKYNLLLSQPSVTNKDLFFDFMHNKSDFLLRNVNFLDMKAPFFKSEIVENIMTVLANGSIGLEWILPKFLNYEKVCIIDSISVDYRNYKNLYENQDNILQLNSRLNSQGIQPIFIEFNSLKKEIEELKKDKSIKFKNKLKKFKRPNRRSNGCISDGSYLSNRIMNFS